jgi:nondiscriminating glutamyl-tRNA synthetase
MQSVRVRFAPSPTGYLHIGGARTALYNWLFARKQGGKFILRIEDTDIDRNLKESESNILEQLQWLGLDWDEGPDKGGPFGPYRQSERLNKYLEYALKLLEQGFAYKCYCTEEELALEREAALAQKLNPRYSGRCRSLTSEQEQAYLRQGRKAALRFKVPETKIVVQDLAKGEVEFDGSLIGDFIIIKSDFTPSYNFAVVIDDLDMKISHIIRGDEHLINTPRQIMIYEALKAPLPQFCHLGMLLAPDRSKLSKRHGTTSTGEFREKGYLPEALINYLALLGWSPAEERELFTKDELVAAFSIDRLAKNPAIYDLAKLNWINAHYLRKLSLQKLVDLCLPHLIKAGFIKGLEPEAWLEKLVELFKDYISYAQEIVEQARSFFAPVLSEEGRQALAESGSEAVLAIFAQEVESLEHLNEDNFKVVMKAVQQQTSMKGKALYFPIRAALTGQVHGPDLSKICSLLGKEKVLERIRSVRH